jgi:hypothetical protein
MSPMITVPSLSIPFEEMAITVAMSAKRYHAGLTEIEIALDSESVGIGIFFLIISSLILQHKSQTSISQWQLI